MGYQAVFQRKEIKYLLTRVLTKERIYKASFSKYGTAYRTSIAGSTDSRQLIMDN